MAISPSHKAQRLMAEQQIPDWMLEDVFKNGESIGEYKKRKRYDSYGYIIELIYAYQNSGEYLITWINKRNST